MSETMVIAMSGGVDSSVCAQMMVDEGFDCVGMTMRLYKGKEAEESCNPLTKSCCGHESVEDARLVADAIGIPYYAINFREEFWKEVIERFAMNYFSGKTPSPCILCNEKLKFKTLYDKAVEIGASKVSTGHYARIRFDEASNRWQLLRGIDKMKDQSYFLFSMTQKMLSQTLFPLGNYTKSEIRSLAGKKDLVTANKQESQDICFIPDGNYSAFLERHFASKLPGKGEIRHVDGTILGEHEGVHRYTIGQRKGLVGGAKEPLFVTDIDVKNNAVIVGYKEHTFSSGFTAQNMNWICQDPAVGETLTLGIKIRSRSPESIGTITRVDQDRASIHFETKQSAVTPGQACVFYDGEKVVGGGWIDEVIR